MGHVHRKFWFTFFFLEVMSLLANVSPVLVSATHLKLLNKILWNLVVNKNILCRFARNSYLIFMLPKKWGGGGGYNCCYVRLSSYLLHLSSQNNHKCSKWDKDFWAKVILERSKHENLLYFIHIIAINYVLLWGNGVCKIAHFHFFFFFIRKDFRCIASVKDIQANGERMSVAQRNMVWSRITSPQINKNQNTKYMKLGNTKLWNCVKVHSWKIKGND